MAISDSDYGALRQEVFRWGAGKEELKALPSLPSETQLRAVFEALESFWETNRATLKAQMDAAAGFTLPLQLARKIGVAWLRSKMGRGG